MTDDLKELRRRLDAFWGVSSPNWDLLDVVVRGVRLEGRAAGLEEAAQEVERAEAKTPGMRVGLAIVAGRVRSLAVSDAREKMHVGTLPAWGVDRDREP